MMFDLTGRVAIVTGGNGGIGLAIAQGLAAAGSAVAIASRNAAKTADAVAAVRAAGGTAEALAVDVADPDSCRAMVEAAVARLGRLDILVNNAGVSIRKPAESYTLAEWNHVLSINLTGCFTCATAALPELVRAGGGKVINIGSMASIFGLPYAAPYAASKGGVVQLTRSLATAWADRNIQVNAILPGWIDTELTQTARVQVAGLQERVAARTPAGRWGRPGDLAGAAVFLACPASDFVTGVALPVDGGYSVMG